MKPGVRVVVEVDGKPVGVLDLDIQRLWPLINHRRAEKLPAEWIDRPRFQTMMRAALMQNLSKRLQSHLYQALGIEIVRAELDIENFALKAEAAAQTFGRTRKDIETLAAKTGRTAGDFYSFFWEYMVDEHDGVDPMKKWIAARKKK